MCFSRLPSLCISCLYRLRQEYGLLSETIEARDQNFRNLVGSLIRGIISLLQSFRKKNIVTLQHEAQSELVPRSVKLLSEFLNVIELAFS